jgi:phosphoglycerate dehydrogenase-like enzyme
MAESRPIVVAAVQPENRTSVFTAEVETRLAEFARVVNLGERERFTAEQMAAALADAHGLITCWGTPKVTAQMARRAKNLKVIAHAAGSLRPIIEREVLNLGIQVTSQAGAIAIPVAEYTIGLILTGLRLLWRQDRLLQESRDWRASQSGLHPCWELGGRTVGVISLSRVGCLVARKLTALEAEVIAYDPYARATAFRECGAQNVSLEELFERATVVTVHAPVTDQTQKMIGAALLRRLPDGALIVNTARGVLFDQAALEAELVSGRLRAALDVTDPEPPSKDCQLFGLPNVLITPHQAGVSVEARRRQGLGAVDDVQKVLCGQQLVHAVSTEQWDILA